MNFYPDQHQPPMPYQYDHYFSTSPHYSPALSSPTSSSSNSNDSECTIFASNGVLIQKDQWSIYEFLLSSGSVIAAAAECPSLIMQSESDAPTTMPCRRRSQHSQPNTITAKREASIPSPLLVWNEKQQIEPHQQQICTATATAAANASAPLRVESMDNNASEALQQQQQRQQQQQAPNPSSHTPTKRDTTRIPNKHTTTTTTTTTTKSKRSRTYKRRGTAGLRSCANCSSTETSVWRKAKKTGETLCNPCGVYQNAHGGKPRPLELKKDSIHSRKRKAGGGAGSISKKQNRKQKRKSALSDTEDEEEEEDEEEDYEMDSENDDAELAPDFKKSCDTEESKDWMLKFGG